jgi:hypothetical protein
MRAGLSTRRGPRLTSSFAIKRAAGTCHSIRRNTFQRPKDEALAMLDKIIKIFRGKD